MYLKDLPNLLTLARIAATVPMAGLFFVPGLWAQWAVLGLFIAAALTDLLDGALARRFGVVSPLGRCLDPIADKLLVTTALFMLAATDRISDGAAVAGLFIVLRELVVSGLREALAGRTDVPVTGLAKWKTATQMTALGLLLAPDPSHPAGLQALGEAILWVSAALTGITGWHYVRSSLPDLIGRRAAGGAGAGVP